MKAGPCALVAATLSAPQLAQAHLVNSGLGPFYDGISHFLLTPEDLVPALALAFLAGLRGARAGRLMLFALPGAWLVGGLAGLAIPVPGNAPVLGILSFLLFGALVAADVPLPAEWVLRLASLAGLTYGFFNGSAMADANLGTTGLSGIVLAVFVIVTLASALVVSLPAPWMRIAVRVAGSWMAAIGLLMLGWSFRGA